MDAGGSRLPPLSRGDSHSDDDKARICVCQIDSNLYVVSGISRPLFTFFLVMMMGRCCLVGAVRGSEVETNMSLIEE